MRAKAITRIIVTAVLTLNALLTASGRNPIPFDENAFGEFVAYLLNGASILWAWWKNNSVTEVAMLSDIQMYANKKLQKLTKNTDEYADLATAQELSNGKESDYEQQ